MMENTFNDPSNNIISTSTLTSKGNSLHTPQLNVINMSQSPNPVSMVQKKCNADITSTTKLNVSGTSNRINISNSDLSPGRTSRSSTISTATDDSSSQFKKSSSHSKISDLAHRVTDYLFATRQSIDLHNPSTSSADGSTKQSIDSPTHSPIVSRENSHVSLSSLARTGGRHLKTTRRSFLSRSNMSPSRESLHTYKTRDAVHSDANTSLTYNNSSTSLSSRNGKFAHPDDETTKKNSHVKETHYVHVEYDPVTRKRVLNTYEILGDLGAGQHGKVKLAKDIDTGKLVAIKIVDRTGKPALLLSSLSRGKSQTQEDKIRKEIAIMKKCVHPNVVKLIEVLDAESSRKIYLVLEYLEKGEVKWQMSQEEVFNKIKETNNEIKYEDCVSEPLLTFDETQKIFRDTLCGLDYLHHQGIIHRDIKPSNLLVSKDNEVKISDFGVSFASNLDGEHQDDVELARTAGTPAFLAPELCGTSGRVKVTYKIDIWALGVTLYCLLFGQLPFHAESEFKLFEKINNKEVEFPDITRWRVAQQLSEDDLNISKDLILKLLDKNPESRIEINEIRKHKFLTSAFPNDECFCDTGAWDKGIKIDVSNEEVNDAIVGLGNRIKKKLTAAFMRKKHHDKDHLGIPTISSASSIVKSFPMLGLKEDCSYILSEENNKNSSSLSMSLLADQNVNGKFAQSRPTTGITIANATFDLEHSEEECETDLPLGASSPSKPSTTGNTSVGFIDDIKEVNEEEITTGHCVPCDDTEDEEYDYRNDLKLDDEVKLTVNPSFASLDSFYDDSYSKFMNASTSTSLGFGSVGPRVGIPMRNNVRVPSNAASPNMTPFDNYNESNEILSMGRRLPHSPSAGFTLSGLNANGMLRNNRMTKPKTSPIQSTANMSAFAANSAMRNPPSGGRVQHPMNPMIRNDAKSKEDSRKPYFMSGSGSSGEMKYNSAKDESKPINSEPSFSIRSPVNPIINELKSEGLDRKTSGSRRAIFTSGNNDSDDEDDDSDESLSFFERRPKIEVSEIEVGPDKALNKSSIYGTKLNLIQHAYNDSDDDDGDDADESEEELFLSFGKSKEKAVPMKPFPLSNFDTDSACVSMDNVFAGTIPTIVDVPANIYQSENSSAGNSVKVISSKAVISGNKIINQ